MIIWGRKYGNIRGWIWILVMKSETSSEPHYDYHPRSEVACSSFLSVDMRHTSSLSTLLADWFNFMSKSSNWNFLTIIRSVHKTQPHFLPSFTYFMTLISLWNISVQHFQQNMFFVQTRKNLILISTLSVNTLNSELDTPWLHLW